MEADLLLKEDEFYKENEKLEMCTKQLMLKAQDALVSILTSTLKSVLSNFLIRKPKNTLFKTASSLSRKNLQAVVKSM